MRLAVFLVVCRLITLLLPGSKEELESITIIGDSQCAISPVKVKYNILCPWLAN